MNTNTIRENLKRGTIDLLILSLIAEEKKYGYQIRRELSERSDGKYELKEATMYPTLYRLLENGYLRDETVKAGKRRTRVYYHLTDEGHKYLEALKTEYLLMTEGIQHILNPER